MAPADAAHLAIGRRKVRRLSFLRSSNCASCYLQQAANGASTCNDIRSQIIEAGPDRGFSRSPLFVRGPMFKGGDQPSPQSRDFDDSRAVRRPAGRPQRSTASLVQAQQQPALPSRSHRPLLGYGNDHKNNLSAPGNPGGGGGGDTSAAKRDRRRGVAKGTVGHRRGAKSFELSTVGTRPGAGPA